MDTEREARTRPRGDLGAIMGGIMTSKRCAETLGFPWWFSGLDSGLPLQETGVRSLARELGSHVPHSMAKKLKAVLKSVNVTSFGYGIVVNVISSDEGVLE